MVEGYGSVEGTGGQLIYYKSVLTEEEYKRGDAGYDAKMVDLLKYCPELIKMKEGTHEPVDVEIESYNEFSNLAGDKRIAICSGPASRWTKRFSNFTGQRAYLPDTGGIEDDVLHLSTRIPEEILYSDKWAEKLVKDHTGGGKDK